MSGRRKEGLPKHTMVLDIVTNNKRRITDTHSTGLDNLTKKKGILLKYTQWISILSDRRKEDLPKHTQWLSILLQRRHEELPQQTQDIYIVKKKKGGINETNSMDLDIITK